MREFNKKGSITVTMTIALFLIITVLLVTLEHAYVNTGRTLALETVDKSMEAVLGEYYAPLYSEYGLMAVACASGNTFESTDDIRDSIADMFNYAIGSDSSDSGIWQMNLLNCRINNTVNLMDNNGRVLLNQIKSQSVYDAAVYLLNDLSDFDGEDYSSITKWYANSKNTVNSSSSSTDDEADNDEDEDSFLKTLTSLLDDGLSGFWFENSFALSDRTTGSNNLPSDDYGLYHTSYLYDIKSITLEDIISGDYLGDLIDFSYFGSFETMLDMLVNQVTDKSCLIAYAGMNLDNYLCNNINGKLMYEQEYLIFGCDDDKSNIKRMGWAIFGIRFAANLIYCTENSEIQSELAAMIAEYAPAAIEAAAALLVLANVLLAVENAVVETAAILRGKSVDFVVTPTSQCVKVSQMLNFNKTMVDLKAKNYKGGLSVKIGYQVYLYAFMFMIERNLLTYRLMDIIQLNMRNIYNKDFKLKNCIVGFNYTATITIPARFTNAGVFYSNRSNNGYTYRVESAVLMPGSY